MNPYQKALSDLFSSDFPENFNDRAFRLIGGPDSIKLLSNAKIKEIGAQIAVDNTHLRTTEFFKKYVRPLLILQKTVKRFRGYFLYYILGSDKNLKQHNFFNYTAEQVDRMLYQFTNTKKYLYQGCVVAKDTDADEKRVLSYPNIFLS